MAKQKLTKTEKKELRELQLKCLDPNGEPKPSATTDDLVRLTELQVKADGEGSTPEATPAEEQSKADKPQENSVIQELVDKGYEYLGTDDRTFYFYGPKSAPGAFRVSNKGLEHVGMRFSDTLLKRLHK